ncbi:hypothetical protein ACEPAI_3527 [Sanghuangporus weigelae]
MSSLQRRFTRRASQYMYVYTVLVLCDCVCRLMPLSKNKSGDSKPSDAASNGNGSHSDVLKTPKAKGLVSSSPDIEIPFVTLCACVDEERSSIALDPQMLSSVLDSVGNLNNLDDRKMLLENSLLLMANTPPDIQLETKLQNVVVSSLYNDLMHPPSSLRLADGSYNNVNLPDMGKAGAAYARSVQQIHPLQAAGAHASRSRPSLRYTLGMELESRDRGAASTLCADNVK